MKKEKEVTIPNPTNNFILNDINNKLIVYQDCRYTVYRFKYLDGINWIEHDGTRINEPLFSFGIYHAGKNIYGTDLNFRVSDIIKPNLIIENYKEIITKLREKRKIELLKERAQRGLYPTIKRWKFNNLTVSLIEEYSYLDHKKYTIFANEYPIRYNINKDIEQKEEIDLDYCLHAIHGGTLAKYNVAFLNEFNLNYKSDTLIESFDFNFLPYQFFINYIIKFKGEIYKVSNYSWNKYLETDKDNIIPDVWDFRDMEIIGELTGIESLPGLMNQYKFLE